ncbi:mercury resistance system periplasmic binding protein MerP [Shewanella psychropiezotolerans]|uniref:Periplasmic mercury ion-binding protein n=2 Tax=Shewanella psychropiezotolerans TaxID=2593655 RepID=A0ABX5X6M2_9GAMM|nr:mercury resistance system periplasmic binding protein MerP [Shewanella psychropiezotolerans]QDO86583.1 mercury resistance system periplasmic binding protein MerP [Shewanella psychropiezotolerans]
MSLVLLASALGIMPTTALAETRSVNLMVPTMDCGMCPITVRKALENLDGVEQAKVDFGDKTAWVIFDDDKVSVERLMEATKDAGYPSEVIEARKNNDSKEHSNVNKGNES